MYNKGGSKKVKTNYKAYMAVKTHYLHYKHEIQWGVITDREKELIETEYSLNEKDLIQLDDARDFTVAIIQNDLGDDIEKNRFLIDMMSAIVFVIDCVKVNRGGEV